MSAAPGQQLAPSPAGEAVPRDEWDAWIAALARGQHGIVARHQLVRAGITPAGIRHRLDRGRLHAIHPGVFAVGHLVLSPRGWWMAAVLAGGEGAVLSHRAAAALHGLIDQTPDLADVLVLRNRERRRGFRPRRVRTIPDEDRAQVDSIPCTSVARTLLDLALTMRERDLDRALRRAEELRSFDGFAIARVLRRGRPGTAALRQAVAVYARDEATMRRLRSELERHFLSLPRAHDFVLPATNVVVATPWGEHEVDTLWSAERIVVELDGWWAHQDRESFRRDHRLAMDVRAAGYDVSRLTWDQVVVSGPQTVQRLARILPRRQPTLPQARGAA